MAQAAEGDDIAFPPGVELNGLKTPVAPFGVASYGDCRADSRADAPDRFPFCSLTATVPVVDHPGSDGDAFAPVIFDLLDCLFPGPGRQGVEDDQAHAVLIFGLTGGTAADAGTQTAFFVVGME